MLPSVPYLGLMEGSTSSGGRPGACAQGTRSSAVTRCEMMASAPPTASTPQPCRYACSISGSSSSGNRATTATAVHPAYSCVCVWGECWAVCHRSAGSLDRKHSRRTSTRRFAARRMVSGRLTRPHEAPPGDMASPTPTSSSVTTYSDTVSPSVARAPSATCRRCGFLL